jgi:hypothetical protein
MGKFWLKRKRERTYERPHHLVGLESVPEKRKAVIIAQDRSRRNTPANMDPGNREPEEAAMRTSDECSIGNYLTFAVGHRSRATRKKSWWHDSW